MIKRWPGPAAGGRPLPAGGQDRRGSSQRNSQRYRSDAVHSLAVYASLLSAKSSLFNQKNSLFTLLGNLTINHCNCVLFSAGGRRTCPSSEEIRCFLAVNREFERRQVLSGLRTPPFEPLKSLMKLAFSRRSAKFLAGSTNLIASGRLTSDCRRFGSEAPTV